MPSLNLGRKDLRLGVEMKATQISTNCPTRQTGDALQATLYLEQAPL
jgi:hypothetical protein